MRPGAALRGRDAEAKVFPRKRTFRLFETWVYGALATTATFVNDCAADVRVYWHSGASRGAGHG